jgi:hypothetical protein
MPQVRVNPQGNLDKDTDVAFVNKGNYIDALNIRHRNADGQNFVGVMPIEGNTNAITQVNGSAATTLSYATSTESYRIYIDVTDIANGNTISHEGSLTLSANGFITPPTPYNYASTTAANAYTAITGHLTNLRGIYNALPGVTTLITFTYGSFVNTDPTPGGLTGYFILTSNINEFDLALFNTVGIYAEIEKETEYIATSGTLSIIGSVQLDDDLFVLSAGSVQNGDDTSQVSEVAILYPDGVGYHYKTLIRSKQLRFHKERNAEMEVERLGSQINLYWTDNLNPPRYIELLYANKRTTLGLLISRGGSYQLANVDEESQLILSNTSAYIEDIQVIHGGGSVTAGNKRYTGRFVTDDFTYSDFLYPTNPVNIYNADPAIPYKVAGNLPTVETTKGVDMLLKNIPQGIYTYFDLVVIEYKGDVFESVLVQRFRINENATELKLRHSNRGQTNEKLSSEELLAISSKYMVAKSLKLFDNRMTLSNLTEQIDLNLEAWASSFTHSLETTQISSVGYVENIERSDLDYRLEEYLNPNNTLFFTSYMMNDTYRFGVQVQWKTTGKWSSPYWVDDIRFDTLADNVNSLDDRRDGNNIDTNLTDITGENVNIYYVNFKNIDLNYLVGGTPIRDLITSIRFVRAERIPEVLTTGYFFPGTYLNTAPNEVMPFFPHLEFDPSGVGTIDRFDFPNLVRYPLFSDLEASTNINSGTARGGVNASDYFYFYGVDKKYNNFTYEFNSNLDQVKILGVPDIKKQFVGRIESNNTYFPSDYVDLGGYFSSAPVSYYSVPDGSRTITDHTEIETGRTEVLASKNVRNWVDYSFSALPATMRSSMVSGDVFKFSSTFAGSLSTSGFPSAPASPRVNNETDGIYYGQIFRNLGANLKYPINKRETVYHSTGHLRILKNGENGVIEESVFGGDVFNQKTHYQLRIAGPQIPTGNPGYAVTFSFYSQNAINTQMFNLLEHDLSDTGSGYIFPQYLDKSNSGDYFSSDYIGGTGYNLQSFGSDTMGAGLFYFLEQSVNISNQNEYSTSYNYVDGVITENGFDNSSTYDGSKPATIAYSASKTIGSTKNGYRYFQPLNFADLDLTNGEITHHDVINDNFYTFQEKSVQRQYFRDASLINSQSGSDVVVGSGSILGSPGQELTSMGTTKKTSVIKGKNPNGKDTAYWYNDRLQKILRLAGDGVTVISDRGLSSYLLNNGKYISNEFYPLSGRGIHGVWNDKYSEAIFTFKYNDGTNKAFTLVYDEIKNGFVSFHSYTPNIYLPYNNTFFSPNPGAQNTIFLHDGGGDYTFYNAATEPYVEVVMNLDPNLPKIFEAIQINSDLIPYGSVIKPTSFATKQHVSYLDNADFDAREDFFYSSIKNDSTVSGLNNGDTSRLFGKWLKLKISLASVGGSQKLLNAIVKFRPSPRLYNT